MVPVFRVMTSLLPPSVIDTVRFPSTFMVPVMVLARVITSESLPADLVNLTWLSGGWSLVLMLMVYVWAPVIVTVLLANSTVPPLGLKVAEATTARVKFIVEA